MEYSLITESKYLAIDANHSTVNKNHSFDRLVLRMGFCQQHDSLWACKKLDGCGTINLIEEKEDLGEINEPVKQAIVAYLIV